jgi:hypothetical protein
MVLVRGCAIFGLKLQHFNQKDLPETNFCSKIFKLHWMKCCCKGLFHNVVALVVATCFNGTAHIRH